MGEAERFSDAQGLRPRIIFNAEGHEQSVKGTNPLAISTIRRVVAASPEHTTAQASSQEHETTETRCFLLNDLFKTTATKAYEGQVVFKYGKDLVCGSLVLAADGKTMLRVT